MKTSREVNKWLGTDGGYVQLPNMPYKSRVFRVSKLSTQWYVKTLYGLMGVDSGTQLEHGVRNDCVTLE